MATKKSKKSKGLQPKTFKGMHPKRFKNKGGGNSKRLPLKKGSTIPVMFMAEPDDFLEYEVHAFQEGGRWQFVPCAGDECPLCDSDIEQVARKSYRFAAPVYNMEGKKVSVLEGGSNLATVVHSRYSRKPSSFLKRVFDITMFPTQPVSFQCELAEEEPLSAKKLARLEDIDLEEYVIGEMKSYYGDDLENIDLSSSLDDDDDEDDDDDDDDDLDDDDDEDDDDEDEDDEPPRKKKSSKSKSSKKKSNKKRR